MTKTLGASKHSPAVYPQPIESTSPIFPLVYKEDFLAKEPKLIKVVIDTNVCLSGIVFGGSPRKVLKLAKYKIIKAYTSLSILLEVAEKLNKKFFWSEVKVKTALKAISKITEIVHPKIKLDVVREDPSDNKVLECAVVADADYIVTGDQHLLKLKKFEETKIVIPSDFLKILK